MSKIVVLFILLTQFLFSYSIELKSGWNLVGLPNTITIQDLKAKNRSIQNVYIFDTTWLDDGIVELGKGVWIDTSQDISISFDRQRDSDTIDTIEIKKGWNLLSLPINTTLSPIIFDEFDAVWKYQDSIWSHYSGKEDFDDIPILDKIGTGEGFWVKSTNKTTLDISKDSSELKPFKNDNQMKMYLRSAIKHNSIYNYHITYADVAIEDSSSVDQSIGVSSKIDNVTTTNLQEKDVDEADIIKHDNNNIFYLKKGENSIMVTSFANLLSKDKNYTKIQTDYTPNNLYLQNNVLVAIYPQNSNYWSKWESIDFNNWSNKSKVEFYDVKNINDIKLISSYKIDGNIVDSRVVDGRLNLVTRFMPYIETTYEKIYVDCNETQNIVMPVEEDSKQTSSTNITKNILISDNYDEYCYYYNKDDTGYFKYNYDNPIYGKEFLIPTISNLDKKIENLTDSQTLYAPPKIDQTPFITTISSFDLNSTKLQESISIIGSSNTIYSSTNSIYLVSDDYPQYFGWNDYKQRSVIYKFSIDEQFSYKGREFIDGRILNQFSLSEYNDILRVATTTRWSWMDETDNIIHTLKSTDDGLVSIGKLEGLGLKGESIKSVRFLQDRGFVVTFRQTDPFYTIDLTDPYNPKKIGEIKIDGFSTYIHPIDQNSILSIGRDADENGVSKGIQIELFDISDFSNPVLSDKVVIGDSSYNSEALYNHKAFTFRNSDMKFSLPINYYTIKQVEQNYGKYEDETDIYFQSVYTYHNYLSLYQITPNGIDHIKDINSTNNKYEYDYQRGIIFSKESVDYVLYFNNGEFFLEQL